MTPEMDEIQAPDIAVAHNQSERESKPPLRSQFAYWKKQLSDLAPLELLTDRPRPSAPSFKMESASISLPASVTRSLVELATLHGTRIEIIPLAAFYVLLSRYTAQNDIAIASPCGADMEVKNLIGPFPQVQILRTNLSGDPEFPEILRRVRETFSNAQTNADVRFDQLIKDLEPRTSSILNSLLRIRFSCRSMFTKTPATPLNHLPIPSTNSAADIFDLRFSLAKIAEGWRVDCESNSDVFHPGFAARILGHFATLLDAIADNPNQRSSELSLLTQTECRQLLVDWNVTHADFPIERCLHQLFEEQVERTPNEIAAVSDDWSLSYAELNHRANSLAQQLLQSGVQPETLVAICPERSLEMVVGLLAILKAGGAYVPLDPTYPQDRIEYMLKDSQASVLLVHKKLLARFPPTQAKVIYLDHASVDSPSNHNGRVTSERFANPRLTESEIIPDRRTDHDANQNLVKNLVGHSAASTVSRRIESNPESNVRPENLAYVIYTSGSTGKPKGVQISHRGIVNFLQSMRREPGMTPQEILLSVTTLSFDIAGLELFLPLTTGARLVIANRETTVNGASLAAELNRRRATVMQATPVTWRSLVEAGWTGSPKLKALCGGEAMPPDLLRQLLPKCASLWNMYGPTETTVWSTSDRVLEEDGTISIGKPVANTQIYLLDAHLKPVPIGVAGELCIGGEGLARGYLNRPDITAEKFIPNPFSDRPGGRIYRTGDLARYLPDGRIECLGRRDHQVKLRGFRIELGEIESQLAKHPEVRRAVAVIREDAPGEKRLVAYLVPSGNGKPASEELRDFLMQKLPAYMAPSVFQWLDSLPLTPNGKVDRRALPAPQISEGDSRKRYVAPRSPIEEILARIWEELFGLEKVGIDENFFELGGHSLLSVQVIDRLNRAGLGLGFEQFIQHQTIAELAPLVTTTRTVPSTETGWSSLVTMQAGGENPPFYLVHTAPGDVLGYMKLVYYLGADRPCYGFQSLGLTNKAECHRTLPEMAAHYVKLMREFQPKGPYFFGGWCFGGVVAMEMAYQLVELGQKVGLLALLETRPKSPPLIHYRFYLHRLKRFLRLGPTGIYNVVRRKIRPTSTATNNSGNTEDEFAFGALRAGAMANREFVYTINSAAEHAYTSRPYAFPGRITLINGAVSDGWDPNDPNGGFATLAHEIELHKIPGGHRSILKEPKVQILAETLKECLLRAQRKTLSAK